MPNKRDILYRCQECKRLLPSAFFPRVSKVQRHPNELVCLTCKTLCRVCGKRVSKADFVEECDCCRKCCANREAAECNVYFRYPVLKYRQAPFDVDKYRDVLAKRPTDG